MFLISEKSKQQRLDGQFYKNANIAGETLNCHNQHLLEFFLNQEYNKYGQTFRLPKI
jgi:hypothetical protein